MLCSFQTWIRGLESAGPSITSTDRSVMIRPVCLLALMLGAVPLLRAAEEMPVLAAGSTVLFIGDSITDGGRARTGNDYNHTMGQGYAFLISARLGEQFAGRRLTFLNRGNSGNRILDLKARWQSDVLDLKPDVLSILIGVNDTFSGKGETLEQYEQTYDELLGRTIAARPGIRIILCEPFLLPGGKYRDGYEGKLGELKRRQEVVARLAAKHHLPLVLLQKRFEDACRRAPADHWCWDGVHPHYAGHALLADAWIRTVAALPGGRNPG